MVITQGHISGSPWTPSCACPGTEAPAGVNSSPAISYALRDASRSQEEETA